MIFTNILDEIRDQCRVATTDTKTTFLRRQVNLAMDEISRFHPWWFTETSLALTLATGQTIALPSRFISMDRRGMRTQNGPIEFCDEAWVDERDPARSDSGGPDHWGVRGLYWFFYPALSSGFVASGTLTARHYQTMKLLATNGTATAALYGDADTPDGPPDITEAIIVGAAYRVLRFNGIGRWRDVQGALFELLRAYKSRSPAYGGAGEVSDGGFAYIVGV